MPTIPIFQLENVTYGTRGKPWLHWNRSRNKEENIDNFIRSGFKSLVLSKSEYWEREYEKRLLILSTDQHYLSIQKSSNWCLFREYRWVPTTVQQLIGTLTLNKLKFTIFITIVNESMRWNGSLKISDRL